MLRVGAVIARRGKGSFHVTKKAATRLARGVCSGEHESPLRLADLRPLRPSDIHNIHHALSKGGSAAAPPQRAGLPETPPPSSSEGA